MIFAGARYQTALDRRHVHSLVCERPVVERVRITQRTGADRRRIEFEHGRIIDPRQRRCFSVDPSVVTDLATETRPPANGSFRWRSCG